MSEAAEILVESPSSQVKVYVRTVEYWDAALKELSFFPPTWIFRGQRDAGWNVRCNLDRRRGAYEPLDAESTVRSEFGRRAHLFLPNGREPERPLEWLALIQHHGGPTRLIDFTRSPHNAAFFALEEDAEEKDDAMCVVWGLDELACLQRAVKRLQSIDPTLDWLRPHHDIEGVVETRVGIRPPDRFVAPFQPSRHNSRLALQQGVFLFLGDPGSDLFGNLNVEVEEAPLQIVKLRFPRRVRREALWSLRRLGISREALFPGLDGLAQSLGNLLLGEPSLQHSLIKALERPNGWPGPVSADKAAEKLD